MLAISLPLAVILGVPLGGALRGAAAGRHGRPRCRRDPVHLGGRRPWLGPLHRDRVPARHRRRPRDRHRWRHRRSARRLAGHARFGGSERPGPWRDPARRRDRHRFHPDPRAREAAAPFAWSTARSSRIREVERPIGMRLRRPRVRMPRRHGAPRSASEAYVASLEVLAGGPSSRASRPRRRPSTPVASAGAIGAPLRQLAADYALAEFGQRTLTPGRASSSDRALATHPRDRHGPGCEEGKEMVEMGESRTPRPEPFSGDHYERVR